jgi:hypothetical protein
MKSFIYSALLAGLSLASPTPTQPDELPNKKDGAGSSTITSSSQISSIIAGLEEDGAILAAGASVLANVFEGM